MQACDQHTSDMQGIIWASLTLLSHAETLSMSIIFAEARHRFDSISGFSVSSSRRVLCLFVSFCSPNLQNLNDQFSANIAHAAGLFFSRLL